MSDVAFSVYKWQDCAFTRYSLLLVEGSIDKMRNIYPLNPRFTLPFVFLLALGLLFMLPGGGSLHAQTPDEMEYPENGTGPVATFTAIDPEMTDIVSWSLAGTDAGVFDIAGGVLTFKKSPDYEMPGDDGPDNMYSVTVQATDETNKVGMKEVTVEVINLDEPGKVTLSALRPQSATAFNATLTDPDSVTTANPTGSITTGVTWQWAKSRSRSGTYANIDNATSSSYEPVDADIGSYLRATASYTDGEDSGKSAQERSMYSAQGVRGANSAPMFAADQDPVMDGVQAAAAREVVENTAAGQAIGDPVVAEDEDGDKLTYTLTGANADSFDINWATGQILTKAALDADTEVEYEVTVRATDPSGIPQAQTADSDNSAEVTVNIMVTGVNEPPDVTGMAAVTFNEVAGQIATTLHDYTADDPETAGTDNDSNWSVTGADGGKFEISDTGALTFEAKPDFEAPGDENRDNVYEVTVVAADSDGNRGTMDVKVTVANEDEPGVVTLSRTRPRVGVAVRATLADPDGSISGLTWQWYDGTISDGDLTQNAIEDAMSDTYTPTEEDATGNGNVTLRARAMYTDGQGDMKSAVGEAANEVAADTRNKAPVFADQDMETDGVQNDSATRTVEENTKALAGSDDDDASDATDVADDNVGSPVMAEDPDPNADPLIYTLRGADAGLFRVRDTGQIEVAAGTALDYETKNTYMVTLNAEDSFGDSASIPVTIMVTDMDEVPGVTGEATIEYSENGMGPVATYTAADPEMTDIVSWSLAGTDAGVFDIAGGVLTFKKSPDYEMPGDDGPDNMYSVTVQATDETNKVGMKEVTVEVINLDEPGKVTLSALRPQSATAFNATLTDPDSVTTANPTGSITTGVTWQWAKSRSRSGTYANIDNATSSSYEPVDADIGSYLRATASYTDGEDSGKSAQERSMYSVQAVRGSASAPMFAADQDPVMDGVQAAAAREVVENTAAGQAIGDPVVAEDEDGDKLTYTLTGANADSFDINWATGQILTKAALDADTEVEYEVTVRATDPSGIPQAQTADSDNSAEVTVNIMVTGVNEPPDVTGMAAVTFNEVAGQIATTLHDYTADDPETAGTDNDSNWSVTGADGGKFEISDTGALTFEAKPDFEAPGDENRDNVYEVTVVAADSDGNRGTMDVKVTVANEDEPGVVTLSRTRPRVGVAVRATLADPDGSISGLTWQWYDGTISDGDLTQNAIEDAMSDTYTPTEEDATGNGNVTLRARAMYTDGQGDMKSAVGEAANEVAADTRNKAPVFADQDMETDGVQNDSATRTVEENTKALAGSDDDDASDATDVADDNVGSPVMAEDPDPNADPLIYTLRGADAGLFRVRDTGQIEVAAGTALDYETKNTYMVTLNAEDSFGDSASIPVTIMVTDMDETPVITAGGLAISGPSNMDYAENGTGSVATYMVSGPDAASASWSLGGDDAGDFTISSGGVLAFESSPDYEEPADADTDNIYMVTVKANDGTYMDTHEVTVMVTNVDEAPPVIIDLSISGQARPEYAENGTGAVATYTVAGTNADSATWSLEGTDAGDFMIDGSGMSVMLRFRSSPDYETKTTYMVTVKAAYGADMDTLPVTITVTDVEEMAPEMSLLERYDENGNDQIDVDELREAITHYILGDIDVDDVREIIRLYILG